MLLLCGYLDMPSNDLDRVIVVDVVPDLLHQLIFALVEFKRPLQSTRIPLLIASDVKRGKGTCQFLTQSENLLVKVDKKTLYEDA